MSVNETVSNAQFSFVFGSGQVVLFTTITYSEDGYTRPAQHIVPESLLNSIAQASQSLNIWNKNTILIGFVSGAFAGL